ncbi:MAG: HesA/MoeB/ThiF family protein [Bacillota bacterium]
MFGLDDQQIRRYSRQLILPQVGGKGQRRLLDASVLVVGAGGLGSPAAYYLAAAGVGTIGLVDADDVDISNLQRQILHSTGTLGKPKVESGAQTLLALNPDVAVHPHRVRLRAANARNLVSSYDVVVNAVDNLATRYLLNDTCVLEKKPLIEAGVLRFDGMVTTIIPGKTPCYRCLFPVVPPPGTVPGCAEAGILGAVAGLVGAIQAGEAIKVLLGAGSPLSGRLLLVDVLHMSFREVSVERNPECSVCREGAVIELVDLEEDCHLQER